MVNLKATLLALTSVTTFFTQTSALGQSSPVTTDSSSSSSKLLKLSGAGNQILLSADDWWGVLRAAQDLAGDFGKVTGRNLTLVSWSGGNSTIGSKIKRNSGREEGLVGRSEDLGKRDWNAPPVGKGAAATGKPSWESGARSPLESGKHEVVIGGEGKKDGTTVYYTFQPVTSFVNVSFQPSKHIFQQLGKAMLVRWDEEGN